MTKRNGVCFAALCLLAGSAWLFDEAWPGGITGLPRAAVHNALLAVVFGAASVRQGSRHLGRLRFWVRVAFAAALMFAVPEILSTAAGGHVSGSTEVLVFLLVPAVVVFVAAQTSTEFGVGQSPMRFMGPALAGLGGAALLLPFDWPPTASGRIWLVAMVASALVGAIAAVRMHALLEGTATVQAAAVICAASSVAVACFCFGDWSRMAPLRWSVAGAEVLRCLVLDGPILLLTVRLLREMKPIPFAARLLLIPLITIVESYLLLRPSTSWTTAAGILLLGGGAFGLLRTDSSVML